MYQRNHKLYTLAKLFYSRWHDRSVTGTILQQSLAGLFNSRWYDTLTVTGTIVQQSLARFFNSHGQDFCFFLCWQNSSAVKITVEKSCHVPGIRHMIQMDLTNSALSQQIDTTCTCCNVCKVQDILFLGFLKESEHDEVIRQFSECLSEKEVSYYVFQTKEKRYIKSGEKKT